MKYGKRPTRPTQHPKAKAKHKAKRGFPFPKKKAPPTKGPVAETINRMTAPPPAENEGGEAMPDDERFGG